MSSQLHKEGGPAFPVSLPGCGDNGWHGMTLRDWFAAQAVAGGFARTEVPEYDLRDMFGKNRTSIRREEILAADAYRIADAMLARRCIPQEREHP
jgi:hypothetical protein